MGSNAIRSLVLACATLPLLILGMATGPALRAQAATIRSAATTTQPVVNVVTDDGAVGDGHTDDTAAFSRAITQLNTSGGGLLVVPAGTYLVQPILPALHSNLAVVGAGAVLRAAAPGYQLLDIAGSQVAVSGLTLDGQNLLVRGLSIESGSNDVALLGDTIENFTQPSDPTSPFYLAMPVGIKIYGDLDQVLIGATTVQNVVAQHPECADPTTCTAVARGILISPGPGDTTGATHVSVRNSRIAHVAPKDDGDCLVIQDSSQPAYLTVADTSFTACSKRAIKIQVPNATILGNTITNPFSATNPNPVYASTLPQDMYAGISVYQSQVLVEDNHVGGTGTYFNGIEIGACQGISDVQVLSNQVTMGRVVPGTSLIRVMGPGDGLAITGNQGSTAVNGIEAGLSGLTNTTIIDNTFTSVTNQIADYSGC